MRMISVLLVAAATAVLPGSAQQATVATGGPLALMGQALPHYDLTSSDLRPWHIKAEYQLYDEKGKHPEQGTFEYWWQSPGHDRSTWTRGSVIRSDWHMGDKLAYEAAGGPVSLFEYQLKDALIAPLPSLKQLDMAKLRIDEEPATGDQRCLTIAARERSATGANEPAQGPFPTYCFDRDKSVLRSEYSFQRVLTVYSDVGEMQGRSIARTVEMAEGKTRLLEAKVVALDVTDAANPAFTPSATSLQTTVGLPDTSEAPSVDIAKDVAVGMLSKKVTPNYPNEAKKARIQGQVVLKATIGTDGKIHDLRVVSAPSAILAESSFQGVSQWEYRPYLLRGKPVAVETTIVVTFALGG